MMEYLKFYNGVSIPQVGFGVYQIPEYEDAKKSRSYGAANGLSPD